ncbi:MAG: PAS domain S-box protein, partial [Dissulfurispiraceae bacterium]
MLIDIMDPNAITKNKDKLDTDLELFRDLINKTNDAIFVSDPQSGRFIFVNDKACTSLGYNRQELLKLSVTDIETAFPDNFSWQTHVDELRQRGSHMFEGIARQKNGITFPVEVNVSCVALNTREYMVAVVRDIAERKKSEAILRQSIEKYIAFYDESPIMLYSVDHTGTIVEVNKHWLNTLGYERTEVIGRKVTDFYTDATRKYAVEVVQPAFFRDGFCKNVEYQLVKKNGEVMDVLLSATGERGSDGQVVLSRGVIEDITERKRVEAALKNSEIMLKTIIETEPECVKLLDADANLLMMNRAGLEMIQVESLDQVKGKCVCPMIAPEDCDSFMDLTRRVFNGESGSLVFKMSGVKGRQLWLETHAVPFRNEKNEIVALLGVTRDITERKLAEQAAEQA